MSRKWYKYALSSAVVACSIYTQGLLNDTFAQQAAQPAEETGSNLEDLKWQLGVMEESVGKQQEQIQALRNRIDSMKTEPAPTAKEDIKKAVEDYKKGEANALNFLIGQVMKLSGKRVDYKTAREILEKELK